MTSYKITFFDRRGRALSQRVVNCEGHWEACDWAWKHKPARTDDFHVEEADFENAPDEQSRKDDGIIQNAFHILRKRAGMVNVP